MQHKTIRLRTLSKNTGLPAKEVRRILKAAGVKDVDGSPYLNGNISVDVKEAFKALKIKAEEAPPPAPLDSPPPDLATIAAKAKEELPDPLPRSTGSGNEDDPVPQYILEGVLPELNESFPMPTNPRSDYVYRPINVNLNRQNYMKQLGWRFVTREDHLREIRPDGLYLSMRTASGRIRHMDLELACLHRSVWERRRKLRHQQYRERQRALEDTLTVNVDEQRRHLRDMGGPGMDKHIDVVHMSEEEMTSRKAFAEQKATGTPPAKSRVFTRTVEREKVE